MKTRVTKIQRGKVDIMQNYGRVGKKPMGKEVSRITSNSSTSRLATEEPNSSKFHNKTQHLHVVRESEMKSTPDHHLDIQSVQGIPGEHDLSVLGLAALA